MIGTETKAVARRVLEEIFPANDLDALREAISDQFVNHEAPPGTPPGLAGIAMYMTLLDQAFSDQRWEIHDVLTDGDQVAMRCTHRGCTPGTSSAFPPPVAGSPTTRCTSCGSSMARPWSTGPCATTQA